MKDERITLKLWPKTVKKLRLIYALTGKSVVSIIDRLADQELDRLKPGWREDEKKSDS